MNINFIYKFIIVLSMFSFSGYPKNIGLSQSTTIDFSLKNLQGERITLENFKGKKLIIVFWALGNPASIAEIDNILAAVDSTKSTVIAVNTDKNVKTEEIELHIESKSWNCTVLLDAKQTFLSSSFEKTIIPSTLLINSNKELIEKQQGYLPGDEEWILSRMDEN